MDITSVAEQLNAGKIGVLPTDTIYGLVAQALDAKAVERVYEIRKRRPDKPCIILIADISDVERFGITIDQPTSQLINQLWPGAVSIVLSCGKSEFAYLHRGTHTLAFRLPDNDELRELLRKTGPLIAPSANPEGQPAATSISKAKMYFDDAVDFYVDAGARAGEASTVVSIEGNKVRVLRQGGVTIPPELL